MTDTTATRVAPAAEAPLTEQISSLVSRETRAYLLGSVEIDGARSEGAVVRALLVNAIERLKRIDPVNYAERITAGESELRRRESSRRS